MGCWPTAARCGPSCIAYLMWRKLCRRRYILWTMAGLHASRGLAKNRCANFRSTIVDEMTVRAAFCYRVITTFYSFRKIRAKRWATHNIGNTRSTRINLSESLWKLELKLFTTCAGKLDRLLSLGPLYFAIQDLQARFGPGLFDISLHTWLHCVSTFLGS
jgi:hypothetical protein